MKEYIFLGTEKRKNQQGNPYFMLYFAEEIDKNSGVGIIPKSSKINSDMFDEFKNLEYGCPFKCNYQGAYDKFGKFMIVIQNYEL